MQEEAVTGIYGALTEILDEAILNYQKAAAVIHECVEKGISLYPRSIGKLKAANAKAEYAFYIKNLLDGSPNDESNLLRVKHRLENMQRSARGTKDDEEEKAPRLELFHHLLLPLNELSGMKVSQPLNRCIVSMA